MIQKLIHKYQSKNERQNCLKAVDHMWMVMSYEEESRTRRQSRFISGCLFGDFSLHHCHHRRCWFPLLLFLHIDMLCHYFLLTASSSDPHRHAAPDHLALSAILRASGWENAASADEGGGLRHAHGGQVAPWHVQEGLPAHTPRLWLVLWCVCCWINISKSRIESIPEIFIT